MTDLDALAKEVVSDWETNKGDDDDVELWHRIAAALLAVRNEALEEAAKVAGEMPYLEPNDDYSPDFNEGWATASAIIAKVIRAMKTTTG